MGIKEKYMKFESEFRIKEKEFRPRGKFKHDQVVDELANIVRCADDTIEDLVLVLDKETRINEDMYNQLNKANDQIRIYQTTIAVLGLCVLLLFIGILN